MSIPSPLVSIISPTYNHEKFIASCIESVQAQSYSNWEMIIIDDGSTDGTFKIASDYAAKDSRIKPYSQENIGIFRLAESYNFALSKCLGSYIAILECDDIWFPNKLEIQIKVLEKDSESILSWGKAYQSSIDLSHNYCLAPLNPEDQIYFSNKPTGEFLRKYIFKTLVPALTIIIRKEALLKIGGFIQGHNLPLVDFPTILELLMQGEFSYVDQPLGSWRIYPGQITKTYTVEMTLGFYKLIEQVRSRYLQVFERHNLTKEEIREHFCNRLVVSYSRSGRYKLIRKNFKGARKDYITSIFHFGFRMPVWKLRSIVGLFFSLFKMDIEWLAKSIGNESYK